MEGWAGSDVTRWVGTHPSLILDDPSERRRFGTFTPPEDLYELMRNTYVAGSGGAIDCVLVAWGCRPQSCPYTQGGIAIEVAMGHTP